VRRIRPRTAFKQEDRQDSRYYQTVRGLAHLKSREEYHELQIIPPSNTYYTVWLSFRPDGRTYIKSKLPVVFNTPFPHQVFPFEVLIVDSYRSTTASSTNARSHF